MNYQIETGIPVPPQSRPARNYNFPLRDMRVGDSFRLPGHEFQGARRMMNRIKQERHWTYVSRLDGDGYRIWRTA